MLAVGDYQNRKLIRYDLSSLFHDCVTLQVGAGYALRPETSPELSY
jgi:hypothetical protein